MNRARKSLLGNFVQAFHAKREAEFQKSLTVKVLIIRRIQSRETKRARNNRPKNCRKTFASPDCSLPNNFRRNARKPHRRVEPARRQRRNATAASPIKIPFSFAIGERKTPPPEFVAAVSANFTPPKSKDSLSFLERLNASRGLKLAA